MDLRIWHRRRRRVNALSRIKTAIVSDNHINIIISSSVTYVPLEILNHRMRNHMLNVNKSVEIHYGEFVGTSKELLKFLRVAGEIGYASCMVELSGSSSYKSPVWLIEINRPIAQDSMMNRDESIKRMTDAFTKNFERRFAFKVLFTANRYGDGFENLYGMTATL